MSNLRVAILAGGESRRMGRDKAKLELRGQRLLERVARAASEVAPTAVVGREDAEAFELPGVEFVPDREPGLGPLGGLATALEHFARPTLVVGCDMPRVDAAAIRWIAETWETESTGAGLIAETEEALQPLFAVYAPELLDEIEAMLEVGERSLHRLVERAELETLPVPASIADRLVNVNTPGEFRELDD